MANPELLILDEPCNGLDLFAREELLSRIGEMAHKESPTLIYVTHHTEEILPIFDHIMMLKNGKIHFRSPGSFTKKQLTKQKMKQKKRQRQPKPLSRYPF